MLLGGSGSRSFNKVNPKSLIRLLTRPKNTREKVEVDKNKIEKEWGREKRERR